MSRCMAGAGPHRPFYHDNYHLKTASVCATVRRSMWHERMERRATIQSVIAWRAAHLMRFPFSSLPSPYFAKSKSTHAANLASSQLAQNNQSRSTYPETHFEALSGTKIRRSRGTNRAVPNRETRSADANPPIRSESSFRPRFFAPASVGAVCNPVRGASRSGKDRRYGRPPAFALVATCHSPLATPFRPPAPAGAAYSSPPRHPGVRLLHAGEVLAVGKEQARSALPLAVPFPRAFGFPSRRRLRANEGALFVVRSPCRSREL